MKKVLLIGDIGEGNQGFYHVGDELMLFYNYKVLEQHGYEVFVTSRSHISKYKNTILDINFSGCFRIIKLVFILLFYKWFPKQSVVSILIGTIKNVDDIIFSGGGNLNSIWKGHLYYRFLITYFAKKYKKNLYLSAQTIGPLYGILDFKLLNYILEYCKIISLRDFHFSIGYISERFKDKIKYFQDDALIKLDKFEENNMKRKEKKSDHLLKVGLSLHGSINTTGLVKQLYDIQKILISLYDTVQFYKIPHMFDNTGGYDEYFMTSIPFMSYENEFNPTLYKETIEEVYNDMDLIITTRYHGGVIAMKDHKPVIMIGRNQYEIGKFKGLVDLLQFTNCMLLQDTDEIVMKDIKNIINNNTTHLQYETKNFFIYYYIKNDTTKIN